ncbi:uncharacterized protein An15g02570 [Aspergillus niger]|uniref:Contig An15c0110, genomic contig n=2 Tax=Aspergillus niger TaxID=5061 RepID=A2R537_ASPNC|nr:uncharacterized protein An15g02570 [Aspergillus niger]CAL00411.1 unnamed protein product [Aspergillus niger]
MHVCHTRFDILKDGLSSAPYYPTSHLMPVGQGVSPNGLCGPSNNDWACFNSSGSTDDYCGANCDSNYGPCSGTISTNGLCGADNGGYTCFGSQFGSCCSTYGYCGSTDEYCASAVCDSSYGGCR